MQFCQEYSAESNLIIKKFKISEKLSVDELYQKSTSMKKLMIIIFRMFAQRSSPPDGIMKNFKTTGLFNYTITQLALKILWESVTSSSENDALRIKKNKIPLRKT